jgi:hypothetical protein
MKDFKQSGRATKELYSKGKANYDFSKNKPINPLEPKNVEPFTNIVWRRNI